MNRFSPDQGAPEDAGGASHAGGASRTTDGDLPGERFPEALRRLSGDRSLLREMATIVLEDVDPILEQIRDGLEQQDGPGVARAAHQLRGMLSTFETGPPVADLQTVIDSARDGDHALATARFDSLLPALRRLFMDLERLRQTSA